MTRKYLVTEDEFLSVKVDESTGEMTFTRDNGQVVSAGTVGSPLAEQYRDEAVAARDAAVAARDAAEAVPTTNDTVMAAVAADESSAFAVQLAKQAIAPGASYDQTLRAQATLAPPENTPTVVWDPSMSTGMTSPVEYRPAACGTGVAVTDWDGSTDPNFRFHSGLFWTNNGANGDLALYGMTKPGGAAQAAYWPMIVEFDTSAGADTMEIVFYAGSAGSTFKIEVNGLPAVGDYSLRYVGESAGARKATLTFPDVAAGRRIRLYMGGASGFHSVRVPTGASITRPTDTIRRGAIIGDSFTNGSGSAGEYPAGAGIFDTWPLRVLKALGCNDFVLAGIGGTGFVNGAPDSNYESRLYQVLSFAPDVLIVSGSVNDSNTGDGVAAAAADFFTASSAVTERYAVGTMRAGWEANHDAVRDAADAAGVRFIPMKSFLDGTGTVTAPTGDGNGDVFTMPDGVHPTFVAHRAIEEAVYRQMRTI